MGARQGAIGDTEQCCQTAHLALLALRPAKMIEESRARLRMIGEQVSELGGHL